VPGIKPVIDVVADEGTVINGTFGPLTNDQDPVPTTGVLPAIVIVLPQRFCGVPASAAVTVLTVIGCELVVVPHSFVTPTEIT
jgi:hypothetical protein